MRKRKDRMKRSNNPLFKIQRNERKENPPSWLMHILFISLYLTDQSLFSSFARVFSFSWPLNSGAPELSPQIYSGHYVSMWAHLLIYKLISEAPTSAGSSRLVYPIAHVMSTLEYLKGISSLICPKQIYFSAHSSFHPVFYSSVDGITIHPVAQSRNLVFPLSYLVLTPHFQFMSNLHGPTFKINPNSNPSHNSHHYYSALNYHHLFSTSW